eukprot:COSAG02_NODE_12556_length_1526_cov_1.416258_2_plen_460_part_01
MEGSPTASPWEGLTLVSPMLSLQLSEADTLARSLRASATKLLEQWDSPQAKSPLESALSTASAIGGALIPHPPPAAESRSPPARLKSPRQDLSHLRAESTEQLLESHEQKTADMMDQHQRDLEELMSIGLGRGASSSPVSSAGASPERLTPPPRQRIPEVETQATRGHAAELGSTTASERENPSRDPRSPSEAELVARAIRVGSELQTVFSLQEREYKAQMISDRQKHNTLESVVKAQEAHIDTLQRDIESHEELAVAREEVAQKNDELAVQLEEAQSERARAEAAASYLEGEVRQALSTLRQPSLEMADTADGELGTGTAAETSALELSCSEIVEAASHSRQQAAVAQFVTRRTKREHLRLTRNRFDQWLQLVQDHKLAEAHKDMHESHRDVEAAALEEISTLQEQLRQTTMKLTVMQEHQDHMKEHIQTKDAEVSQVMAMNTQTMILMREAIKARDQH